jgi:hypothetical protein
MASEITTTGYDAESDIAAWVVGSGMMLIQACAVIPGLLPCLLLLLPLALPLLVLGAVVGLPVALAVGAWCLGARVVRPLRGRPGHLLPPASATEPTANTRLTSPPFPSHPERST